MKSSVSGKRRSWKAALEKVEAEGQCRVCGTTEYLDAAHTISRKAQDVEVTGSRGGRHIYVMPDSVVPLCNGFANGCHGLYDGRELDLLPYLSIDEQLNAVDAAGGIEMARRRLCPSEYAKGPLLP